MPTTTCYVEEPKMNVVRDGAHVEGQIENVCFCWRWHDTSTALLKEIDSAAFEFFTSIRWVTVPKVLLEFVNSEPRKRLGSASSEQHELMLLRYSAAIFELLSNRRHGRFFDQNAYSYHRCI